MKRSLVAENSNDQEKERETEKEREREKEEGAITMVCSRTTSSTTSYRGGEVPTKRTESEDSEVQLGYL